MKRPLAALVTAMMVAALATPASAVPSPKPSASRPTAGKAVSPSASELASLTLVGVQYDPNNQGLEEVIVTAAVPESVKLPVKIRLPLVKGGTIRWSGEIFPNIHNDKPRPAVITSGTAGDVVEITALESRTVQYEVQLGPCATGKTVERELEWIQTVETGKVSFSVEVPPNTHDVRTTPAYREDGTPSSGGYTVYLLPSQNLKVGDRFTVRASYKAGAPAPFTSDKTSSGNSRLLMALAGALAIVVAAIAVLAIRQNRPAGEDAEVEDDDDEDIYAGGTGD